jgi:hypothetical protein
MFVHIDLRLTKRWIDWKMELTWGKLVQATKEEITDEAQSDSDDTTSTSEPDAPSSDGKDHVKSSHLPGGPIGFQPPELSMLWKSN